MDHGGGNVVAQFRAPRDGGRRYHGRAGVRGPLRARADSAVHRQIAMAFSESDLAMADQRLPRARERLERQSEIIQELAVGRQDTASAEAALKAMRRTLENFEEDRRAIEDEMFAAKANRAYGSD